MMTARKRKRFENETELTHFTQRSRILTSPRKYHFAPNRVPLRDLQGILWPIYESHPSESHLNCVAPRLTHYEDHDYLTGSKDDGIQCNRVDSNSIALDNTTEESYCVKSHLNLQLRIPLHSFRPDNFLSSRTCYESGIVPESLSRVFGEEIDDEFLKFLAEDFE
jgi:hypothetical protein